MPNMDWNPVSTYVSILLTTSLLLGGCVLITTTFAEDDEKDASSVTSNDKGDQEIKQKQKCKIGVFGDPQDTVTSTVLGLCNQQAQNNIDSDSNLGGIGISTGPQ
jgi:hypothetical protein